MSVDKCQHRKRGKIDDCVVCTDCGTILAKDELVETAIFDKNHDKECLWPELRNTQKVLFATISQSNRLLHELCLNICMLLRLPEVVIARTNVIVDLALERKLINRGRLGRRAVATTIYLLARMSRTIPLAMREVADLIGESATELCQAIDIIKPLIIDQFGTNPFSVHDPAVYLEKFCKLVTKTVDISSEQVVVNLAADLCQFCEEASLVEGRKPEALSLACLLISLEPIVRDQLKPKEWKLKTKELCDNTGISIDTVMLRYNEIKDALIGEASKHPFSIDRKLLKRDKIALFLDEILKFRKLSTQKSLLSPPSYIAGRVRIEERRAQINRAQERIKFSTIYSTDIRLEDIIIERLLLHKVEIWKIESAANLKQLMNLEEEITIAETDELG